MCRQYISQFNVFSVCAQNNIFIEPENVRYFEGGGIQQTDGSYKPSRERFGGANYFERQSQILHLVS